MSGARTQPPRSPTHAAGSAHGTAHSNSTPSLRVLPVQAAPSTVAHPVLDARLASIEDLLAQRKDLLMKLLHENNEGQRDTSPHQQQQQPARAAADDHQTPG